MSYTLSSPSSVVAGDRQSSSGRYGLIGRKGLRGGRMTKVNGRAASYADEAGCASYASASSSLLSGVSALAASLTGSVSPTALSAAFRRLVAVPAMGTIAAAAIAVPALVGTSGDAAAACVETGAGTSVFNCTTNETLTQDLDGAPGNLLDVNVSTAVTFDTTGTGGDAFNLYSYNGIDFTQAAGGGDISGLGRGIFARNIGGGALSITATGAVSGTTAVQALNSDGAPATDLILNLTTVTGVDYGIRATSHGSGVVTITATGAIMSTNQDGIDVLNDDGTDLTLNVTSVAGGGNGIDARNDGTGSTSITATGAITTGTDATDYGITTLLTNAAAGNLTVNTAAVTAQNDGIFARSSGLGVISITSTGLVQSTAGDGIEARNTSAMSSGITVNVATVNGGDSGVVMYNSGTGNVTFNATGNVTGTSGNGVVAYNFNAPSSNVTVNTIAVTAGNYGISTYNGGSGVTTVTATGAVVGGVTGIYSRHSGTNLSITGTTVTGGNDGIDARNYGTGSTSIVTSGDVTGTTGSGIRTTHQSAGALAFTVTANVMGGTYGVYNTAASRGGAFTIAGTGSVSSGSGFAFNDAANGVFGDASSTLDVYGQLLGDARMGIGADQVTIRSTAALGANSAALGMGNGAQLDGDNGAGSHLTGQIDNLTFDGWSSTLDGARIVNFEQVILTNGADVTFTDVLAPGTGLANTNPVDGLLLQVNNGSFARFAASFTVAGNVNNMGTLDLSSANGTADTVLTISGNFVGSSSLVLDTTLGGDASPTDMLVVGGNTSGTTNVTFNVVGGTGAQTDTGIRVVDVDGMSDGTFVIANPDTNVDGVDVLVAGAYAYRLTRGDDVGGDSSSDWFLKAFDFDGNLVLAPSTPIYEQLPAAMAALNDLSISTLQQRVGNRYWNAVDIGSTSSSTSPNGSVVEQSAIWTRFEGVNSSTDPDTSTTSATYDINTWQVRAGFDLLGVENEEGLLVGGVNVAYGESALDVSSRFGNGDIDTTGYTLGGTLTWYGFDGLYADGQAHYSWFDSEVTSDLLGRLADSVDGTGTAVSLEVGKRFALSETGTLIPQAQLVYSSVDFDDFTDLFGAMVSMEDGDSLEARMGLAAEHASSWYAEDGTLSRTAVYGIANVNYEFLDGSSVNVSGTLLDAQADAWTADVGVGGSYNWNDDAYSLYAEASYGTSLSNIGDSYTLKGNVGFRVKW